MHLLSPQLLEDLTFMMISVLKGQKTLYKLRDKLYLGISAAISGVQHINSTYPFKELRTDSELYSFLIETAAGIYQDVIIQDETCPGHTWIHTTSLANL